METTFTCSICGEPSRGICEYCTKDTCENHLCERCGRCSDCCDCEFRVQDEAERLHTFTQNGHLEATHEPEPGPEDVGP